MIWMILFCLLFAVNMAGMYLVKDYRKGVIYKGFIGKVQDLIKH